MATSIAPGVSRCTQIEFGDDLDVLAADERVSPSRDGAQDLAAAASGATGCVLLGDHLAAMIVVVEIGIELAGERDASPR